VELVIALNGSAIDMPLTPGPHEKVVVSHRPGRGYALVEGAHEAGGDVILFLHSDTTLPVNWNEEVRDILSDDRVIGGAFSLSFDTPLMRMRAMVLLSDLWRTVTGHLWGDRAIFVRAGALRECLDVLEVPIFEDVRLSRQMHRRGKVRLSKAKVITSWSAFRRNGALGHLWLIVKCHYLYIVGWDPERIYERYYR
jgi:glycosyltransferase involved in cell wall biosynthesis